MPPTATSHYQTLELEPDILLLDCRCRACLAWKHARHYERHATVKILLLTSTITTQQIIEHCRSGRAA